MKITIYQLPFQAAYQSHITKENRQPITAKEVGYIELETFDRDECWHLGNWTAWTDEKPSNLHYEGRSFSSSEIFHDPSEDKYHYAMPFGWYEANSVEEVIEYLDNYKFGQELKNKES